MSQKKPSLYGINHSNRTNNDLWGKNQFNSSFPISLACYMRDTGCKAVYLHLNKNLEVEVSELSFDDIFQTKIKNDELYFAFESKYEPYQRFSRNDIGNIDLVIKDTNDNFLLPLEIKLTVLPDSGTSTKSESEWGSELVIRPATTKYCALGIAESCQDDFKTIRELFEPIGAGIQDWGNTVEILANFTDMLDIIDDFQKDFYCCQKPLLMQPLWKTQGQNPLLAENAFDIFIWSDFALSRLFLDNARNKQDGKLVNRQMRSAARFFRSMYHVSTSGKIPLDRIYTEMSFGRQTDKEFAVNGSITNKYMRSKRLLKPVMSKDVISKVILNGGEKLLKPERRFDQTLYFTVAK